MFAPDHVYYVQLAKLRKAAIRFNWTEKYFVKIVSRLFAIHKAK